MPVINIGGTEYDVSNFDSDTNDSTLWDDYLLTGTESILSTTVIKNETFLSLDVDDDGELDLYGKLGENDAGEKYIDLRDDDNELRSLSLLDDIDDMTVGAAVDALSNILISATVVDDNLQDNIKKVLEKVFVKGKITDDLVTNLVDAINSPNNAIAVANAYAEAVIKLLK